MKKYLLGLFVCFFSIALSCNAFAFPEYGNDCAQCHGAPVDSNPPPVEPDPPPAVSNNPPVADAGPDQSVDEGVAVTLDGSNSNDRDNGIKSYFWTQVGGSLDVALSNDTAVRPRFDTPNVGPDGMALTFRLRVTDASGATDADTTIVNVSWVNIEPVADAGADQTIAEGTQVTLDGSLSNGVDDGIATYVWDQVDIKGVIAVLSDPNSSNPQFTITERGINGESLTFELTVTDEGGLQATDRCVVNVTHVNQAPVANAGDDQTVTTGDEVMLDASGSYDPDNDISPDTAYTWKQTAGTAVTLSAPGAIKPVFTAPEVPAGTGEVLVFELTVTDSGLLKATDVCEIQVDGATLPPVGGPPIDEAPVDEPPVEEPPVVEPPSQGAPVEQSPVVGSPDDGSSAKVPPMASIAMDQMVTEGQTVFINGGDSTDDLGIFSYAWLQLDGHGGAVIAASDPYAVMISDPFDVQISFVTPSVEVNGAILTFQLTVTDGDGAQDSTEVQITVEDNGITDFDGMPGVISTYSADGQPIGIGNTSANDCTRFIPLGIHDVAGGRQQPKDAIYGFIDFELRVNDHASTSVTIYLPAPAPAGYKWYKYTDVRGWFDFSRDVISNGSGDGAVFNADRTRVTIHITDNGEFDDDPTPDIIRDPGGLASGLSGGSGSSLSSCFINSSINDSALSSASRINAANLFVCLAAGGLLFLRLRRRPVE